VSSPTGAQTFRVGEGGDFPTINAALDAWGRLAPKPRSVVIEIVDSGVYTEQLGITLAAQEQLQIRAASGRRPVIRLLDYRSDRSDAFRISGGAGSSFVLDGLLVTGRGLRVYGPDPGNPDEPPGNDLCEVVVRHTTLVPGWGIDIDCDPRDPNDPSVELINTRATLRVEHSIIGAIEIAANEVLTDPVPIVISDSVFDAVGPDRAALGAESPAMAFARLDIRRSTVFGAIRTHAIDFAEDCLFTGDIHVARRQVGCMRFCYVPPGSRTPRREQCQPDLVDDAVAALPLSPDQRAQLTDVERERVRPRFRSQRYGRADYAELDDSTAAEIFAGASDEGEMGVFHDLFVPKRAANLDARLAEFTPADSDAETVFST
jgi:hypothetical protein